MIDQTQAGTRCYTVRFIRTVKGDLPRGSYGTVLLEFYQVSSKSGQRFEMLGGCLSQPRPLVI